MTECAQIPLGWLRSKDPYHRFLMWLIPGISHDEVPWIRFSIRTVSWDLGVSKRQACQMLSRAIDDGFLSLEFGGVSAGDPIRIKGEGGKYFVPGLISLCFQSSGTRSGTSRQLETVGLPTEAGQEVGQGSPGYDPAAAPEPPEERPAAGTFTVTALDLGLETESSGWGVDNPITDHYSEDTASTKEEKGSTKKKKECVKGLVASLGTRDSEANLGKPTKPSTSTYVRAVIDFWNFETQGKLPKAVSCKTLNRILPPTKDDPDFGLRLKQAIHFLLDRPFYQGANDRGWTATLSWVLERGKLEEFASRSSFKPAANLEGSRTAQADREFLALMEAR